MMLLQLKHMNIGPVFKNLYHIILYFNEYHFLDPCDVKNELLD